MKNKSNSDEIPPLMYNNMLHYSIKEKANVLNDFFISQAIVENDEDTPHDLPQQNSSLTDIEITVPEVREIIMNLDKCKAVGPDLIHNKLLIAACPIIEGPLTKLFNKSLNERKFPTQWKLAYVTPLYKKGPKELCSNYRPVSLLSCVGKVFERCVHKHVFNYLNDNALLTPLQSGFVPGDSTVNQLLRIYDDLCTSFDDGVTTQAVYFDISKAFDKVWHRGLLAKLKAIGVRNNLLAWFQDYLSNRSQSVVIKGECSEIKTIKAGVPQGSVLGPLLFLIYINDIVENIDSVN